jgi:hypothetical protein
MTCDEARPALAAREPTPRVRSHLKECDECARLDAEYSSLDEDLREAFRCREIIRRARRRRFRFLFPAGAAVLLLAGAIALLYRPPSTDPELEAFAQKTGRWSNEAVRCEDEQRFDEAMKLYDRIIAECHKLSPAAREKAGEITAVYKLRRMNCEHLSRRVEEADAAFPRWSESVEPRFEQLMKEREYVRAKKTVEEFVAHCQRDPKHSEQIAKTKMPKSRIVPEAKAYLRKFISQLSREDLSREDLRNRFDEEVARCFQGILSAEEIERAWERVANR